MTAVRAQEISDWTEIERHACAWRELVGACPRATVFQTYEWQSAWWRVFGAAFELRIVFVWRGDTLVGIAPWMVSRDDRVLRFLGTADFSTDYCDLLVRTGEDDAVPALADWLRRRRSAWRRIDLSNFPSDSPNRTAVERCLRQHFRYALCEHSGEAPTRILADPAQDRLLLGKSGFRRMSGQLRKLGKLEFVCLHAAADILPELETLFRLHIERRATTAAASQFLDPRQRTFYAELTHSLAGAGWLRFWALRLDGAAIAVLLGFEFGPRFVGYKPAFSLEYAKYSPGRLLLKLVLEQAVERGLQEFDFTVGREPYKREFANHSRTTHRLQVFPSLPGYSARVGKRYAKRVLQRCALPLVEGLVSRHLLDPWWSWRGDRPA